MALTRSSTAHRDGKTPLRMCLCRSIVAVIVSTLYLEVVAFQTPLAASRNPRPRRQLPLCNAFDDSSLTFDRVRDARFCSPLLEEGYPPVVDEYETGAVEQKPLLIFLPGFDGTYMTLFLQLPELSDSFDVRCLTISMKDRSTYQELKELVVDYISMEIQQSAAWRPQEEPANKFFPYIALNKPKPMPRPIYLVGESFGGILAADVALILLEDEKLSDSMKGMTLINAATCYDRSKLASMGPSVTKLPPLLYPFGLIRLLPLFTDEFSVPSLLLMLQAKALPSVIDSEQREAYMGRMAFSIPQKLQYMTQNTLQWRLTEWLETGCAIMESRLERFRKKRAFRALIVAGEKDLCLPSIGEAERLSSVFTNPHVFVVEGAGHASTCGSRIDMAAVLRKRFPEINGRTAMKPAAAEGKGPYLGMEPRYDAPNSGIGLSPLNYWNSNNYRRMKPIRTKPTS
jgi:pimeloyl-ACP methyl ester carboxylesterase